MPIDDYLEKLTIEPVKHKKTYKIHPFIGNPNDYIILPETKDRPDILVKRSTIHYPGLISSQILDKHLENTNIFLLPLTYFVVQNSIMQKVSKYLVTKMYLVILLNKFMMIMNF